MKSLKTIMVEYAQEHGGGLPLTAQEICNAVVLWVQQYLNTPSQNPTEPELPVLGVNGAIEWKPVSSFIGGGGGTKLYKHHLTVTIIVNEPETGNAIQLDGTLIAISNENNPITYMGLLNGTSTYINISGKFHDEETDRIYYVYAGSGLSLIAYEDLADGYRVLSIKNTDFNDEIEEY